MSDTQNGGRSRCLRLFPLALPTLAAGTLAAVNDGQNDRLDVSAGALQAEEAHGVLRVQPVTAAVAKRLQVGLLRQRQRQRDTLSEAKTDEPG